MKSIHSFILIAVCMIAFTATATTAKLEQKQKAELVQEYTFLANAVSVVNDYQIATAVAEAKNFVSNEAHVFVIVKESITFNDIVIDVGYSDSKQLFLQEIYQKELLSNYNKENNLPDRNKVSNRIRNDC